MGRPTSPLTATELEPALAYIRRALERGADLFSKPPKVVGLAYATLLSKRDATKPADYLQLANEWVDAFLTRDGRATMRTAMRRRRADAAGSPHRPKTLRVNAQTHADIERLAKKLGLPVARTLGCLAQAALVDKDLQTMVQQLAIAMELQR
jgi:hypothetical protein